MCEVNLVEDLAIPPSNPMLDLLGHRISSLEMFVSPSLVTTKMFFRPMMAQDLNGPFGLDTEVLFIHVAPHHVRVMERIGWAGNEGPRPPYLEKELLPHWHSPSWRSLGLAAFGRRYSLSGLPTRGPISDLR